MSRKYMIKLETNTNKDKWIMEKSKGFYRL